MMSFDTKLIYRQRGAVLDTEKLIIPEIMNVLKKTHLDQLIRDRYRKGVIAATGVSRSYGISLCK